MKKVSSLMAGIVLLAWMTASAGVIGVDWGGAYGNSFASSLNQGLGAATTDTATDYTFDAVSDAAYSVAFGSVYTPSVDIRYLAPVGKTGPLYTGMQLVNHSSSTVPTEAGIYRFSATTNPNQLQKTNPTNGGSNPMSMSASYFSKKADFLNGLNAAAGISFANAVDAASVSMSLLRNKNNGTATIAFVVQEGSDWYATVALTRATIATDFTGTLTVNPYTADWYAYDPSANQFLNTAALGTAKAGSTFTNITAFGITGQSVGYDGTVANTQKLDFTGFSGSFTAIPEPATIGMLGLGGVCMLLVRRWTRG